MELMKIFNYFFVVVVYLSKFVISSSELLSAVMIYRHGDRAPVAVYPNDPYRPYISSIWPEGLGQLTNTGRKQHYALGTWLRKRYDGFISTKYNYKELKVLSSNVDRCITSASANLAGLYPPTFNQIWNPIFPWQLIPVHTTPIQDDALLAMQKPCPKYKILYDELMNSKYFQDFFDDNKPLFDYLTEHSGMDVSNFANFSFLYDALDVEQSNNLPLPEWATEVFPSKMKPLVEFHWPSSTFTTELARLRAGPLIDYIISHFEHVLARVRNTPKFQMLSAHDFTLVSLLNSLHIYKSQAPGYASVIIFELRRSRQTTFVNIIHKNGHQDAIFNITLNKCEFDCNFNQLKKIVEPVRSGMSQWTKECSEV